MLVITRAPSVRAENGNGRFGGWGVGGEFLPDTQSSSDLELQPHGEDGVARAPSSLLPFWNESHAIPS